jgi:microcystin-dependent protein
MTPINFTDNCFAGTADVQTNMQQIENNFAALKSSFSSATEPSDLVAGMFWYDTNLNILKLRDEANSAWQNIWDFGNNVPMGSAINTGTAIFDTSLYRPLDSVLLATGTTPQNVASYGGNASNKKAFNYTILGVPYVKGPTVVGTAFPTSFTIQNNTWGIYVVSIAADGTITLTPGAGNYTSTYTTEAAAKLAIPATPAGTCRLGYFTVHAPVAGFTEQTTALTSYVTYYVNNNDATGNDTPINSYTTTISPTLTVYANSIYYVKATYRNHLAAPTINFNGVGAKTIKKSGGLALRHNDIIDNHDMVLRYDGTDMILQNPNTEKVGSVLTFVNDIVPSGYKECNGDAISRSTYAALFTEIGIMYGPGDGSTTFNVPNFNGKFLRAWDNSEGIDPGGRTDRGDGVTGDYVGTKQAVDTLIPSHTHNVTPIIGTSEDGGAYNGVSAGVLDSRIAHALTPVTSTAYGLGTETRPVNVSVLYCIKY